MRVEVTGGPPPRPEVVDRIFLAEMKRAVNEAAREVEFRWKETIPKRTRTSARSIHSSPAVIVGNKVIGGEVGSLYKVVEFLEKGTGIYGPRKRKIVPTHAKVLKFPNPGQGFGKGTPFTLSGRPYAGRRGAGAQFLFRRSVKGIRAGHFGAEARRYVDPQIKRKWQMAGGRIAARIGGGFGGKVRGVP